MSRYADALTDSQVDRERVRGQRAEITFLPCDWQLNDSSWSRFESAPPKTQPSLGCVSWKLRNPCMRVHQAASPGISSRPVMSGVNET